MEDRNIDKLVEDTLNSFDGAGRASAKPFLLTRVFARMQDEKAVQNIWTRAGLLLSRPSVALAGVLLIILVNVFIIINNTKDSGITVQGSTTARDEYAINAISIYDIENLEP